MGSVPTSLALGLGSLADRRVLRVMAKSLGVSLVLFVAVGLGGWFALDALLAWAGLADELFTGAGALRGLAAALAAVLGLWLTWRIVAMAVIQFFADEAVLAVEAGAYPEAAGRARDLPLGEQAAVSLRSAGRALVVNLIALPFAAVLLFIAIGPAVVFFLVNAWLIGRELQDMVWLRHRTGPAHVAPVTGPERFLLGAAITALLTVPVVNFIAPVLGAASATHLIHRKDRT